MLSNFSLEGKVVLLTGAAGFLGEHFAHKLHLNLFDSLLNPFL